MTHDYNQDVISIKEWMSKEPYLPQDFDDEVLKKFLHSCYWSLESTKKCLERFCSGRSQMTEVYTSRDPLAPNIQKAFSGTVIACYRFEKEEFSIHKIDDPTLETFSFYDFLKTMSIQADQWIKYHPFTGDGHYLIVDMTHYSLKMVPKINIIFLRDFLLYFLEGLPVRLKKVLAVNAPSYYDKLYALIKPILPPEICNMVHFYSDYQSLYQFIDKKYLPSEYGGEGESMYENSKNWKRRIAEKRTFYLNDNVWKADLTKKPKNTANETMNGSFRTLSID